MESLAVKYRPQTFEEVCGQTSVVKVLNKQVETGSFVHCYLLSGPTGTGKTTIARIFANKINDNCGNPIEIDAASNNGVDNIRQIISEAKERSLDSEYKIYIIDEAHMITSAGWNAFLKCIEEPPMYTIFIFCTTEVQKVPATIMNRVMRFNLNKISQTVIESRLKYICEQEGFTNYDESCNYISRLSLGGMRDAIALLDKCSKYSTDLDIKNVLAVTGNLSYDVYLELTNSIIDKDEGSALKILTYVYNSGADLKVFVDQYLDFVLDLTKYCLFKTVAVTKLPSYLEEVRTADGLSSRCIKYATGFENNVDTFNKLTDKLLDLKSKLRYETFVQTTVEASFINILRSL